MNPIPADVTVLLDRLSEGDRSAWNEVLPALYRELREAAERQFRAVQGNHTLQPTALVHEAWSRLAEREGAEWQDREHFLAVAAMAMRGILVDHARRRAAQKRGGDMDRVTLAGAVLSNVQNAQAEFDVLDLDAALDELAKLNDRQAQVVTLRFFGGMTVEAIAAALSVSKTTVEGDWRLARAWLSVRLKDENAS